MVFRFLLVALILSSCAHLPQEGGRSTLGSLKIGAVSHRKANLLPCGCTINPRGGVTREYNFKKQGFSDGFLFSTGTQFIDLQDFEGLKDIASKKKQTIAKDTILIQSLNEIGITALSPNLEDFALGSKTILELQKQAKFPFVSANIIRAKEKTLVFKSHFILPYKDLKIVVTGLAPLEKDVKEISGMTTEDPAKALSKVLDAEKNIDLLILMASFENEELKTVLKNVSVPTVVLGGAELNNKSEVEQLNLKHLKLTPEYMGRVVAYVEIENPSKGFKGFYEPTQFLNLFLKQQELLKQGKRQDFMPAVPKALPSDGLVPINLQQVILGKDFEQFDNNPIKKLIDGYYQTLNQNARNELDQVF